MRYVLALFWLLLPLSIIDAQDSLLLIQRTWANNPSNESSDCVQVEADGSYHFEHNPMSLGQPGNRQIHAGKLSDEEMRSLREMLDAPALQSLTTPKPGSGSMYGGSSFDLLWVIVGRTNQPQVLYFNSGGGNGQLPTLNGLPAGVTPTTAKLPSVYQTPAIKPLLEWYKRITKRKNDIDKTAAATCSIQIKRY